MAYRLQQLKPNNDSLNHYPLSNPIHWDCFFLGPLPCSTERPKEQTSVPGDRDRLFHRSSVLNAEIKWLKADWYSGLVTGRWNPRGPGVLFAMTREVLLPFEKGCTRISLENNPVVRPGTCRTIQPALRVRRLG